MIGTCWERAVRDFIRGRVKSSLAENYDRIDRGRLLGEAIGVADKAATLLGREIYDGTLERVVNDEIDSTVRAFKLEASQATQRRVQAEAAERAAKERESRARAQAERYRLDVEAIAEESRRAAAAVKAADAARRSAEAAQRILAERARRAQAAAEAQRKAVEEARQLEELKAAAEAQRRAAQEIRKANEELMRAQAEVRRFEAETAKLIEGVRRAEEFVAFAEAAERAAEELENANAQLGNARAELRAAIAEESARNEAVREAETRAVGIKRSIERSTSVTLDQAHKKIVGQAEAATRQRLERGIKDALQTVEQQVPIEEFINRATEELTGLIDRFILKIAEIVEGDSSFQTAGVDTHELGEILVEILLKEIKDKGKKTDPGGMQMIALDQLIARGLFLVEDRPALQKLLLGLNIFDSLDEWWNKYQSAIQTLSPEDSGSFQAAVEKKAKVEENGR